MQRRRQRQAFGREHRSCDEVDGLALHRRRHGHQGFAAAARKVAQCANATNLAHQHADGTRRVVDGVADRAAQHGIVAVGRQFALFLTLKEVACNGQALGCKGDRVAAQVELNGLGVEADEVVLIGAEGQLRLTAACRDALQLDALCCGRGAGRHGLVGVFDGPEVVWAKRGLEGHTAGLPGMRQVDGVVFHYGARCAVGTRELSVGELGFGVRARGAEVVSQAERVAHLVHDDFLDVVLHELARDGAVGVEVPPCFQHIERIAHLLGRQRAVHAAGKLRWHRAIGGGSEWLRKGQRRRPIAQGLRADRLPSQHLGAQRAHVACGHAFKGDVGIQDLSAARIDVAGADGAECRVGVHHPSHRGVAEVEGVEVGVFRLLLDHQRATDANFLEGTVPFQNGRTHRLAVGQRHIAVDPEGDGLDRLRHLGRRVFFLQPPAVYVALARRYWQVGGEVEHGAGEQTQARVGTARRHGNFGQRCQREVQAHQQAARVGQEARHLRRGGARGDSEASNRHAAGVEVALRFNDRGLLGAPNSGDDGIRAVQPVTLAQATLQHHADTEDVIEEEAVRFHQNTLAVGMRQARHRRGAEQAVGVGIGHRARFGRAEFGSDVGVACHQPHLVVHTHELHHLRSAGTVHRVNHQAAQHEGFADAALDLGR